VRPEIEQVVRVDDLLGGFVTGDDAVIVVEVEEIVI
jgi:hypothetical protein